MSQNDSVKLTTKWWRLAGWRIPRTQPRVIWYLQYAARTLHLVIPWTSQGVLEIPGWHLRHLSKGLVRPPKSTSGRSERCDENISFQELLSKVRGSVPSKSKISQCWWCLLRHKLPSGVLNALPTSYHFATQSLSLWAQDLRIQDSW